MFTVGHIAELIADKACIANGCLFVSVRVPENPHIDTAIGDEVAQLRSKGTIKQAAFMLWSHDCQRRQMMGYDNNMLCRTLGDTLFNERQAFLMFGIKIIGSKPTTAISYLPKVVHPSTYEILILRCNMRPQSRENEIRIIYAYHLVLIIMHILQYLTAPTIAIG